MTPKNVTLIDMDEERFREYRKHLVRDYAREKVRAGTWLEDEAQAKSAQDVDALLSKGTATQDHYLYSVRDESVPAEVGLVWIAQQESGVGRSVWIYDIIIHEPFQRQGYARRTLELVEDRARDLEATKVELHVFGHNHAARALYENTGYKPTGIVMAKPLTTAGN